MEMIAEVQNVPRPGEDYVDRHGRVYHVHLPVNVRLPGGIVRPGVLYWEVREGCKRTFEVCDLFYWNQNFKPQENRDEDEESTES